METLQVPANFGIAHRLRRSKGRAGRSVVASTKLTPDEQDELDRATKSAGKAFSEWAREVLMSAARPNGEQLAVITELAAMRMLLSTVLRPVALGLGHREARRRHDLSHLRNQMEVETIRSSVHRRRTKCVVGKSTLRRWVGLFV